MKPIDEKDLKHVEELIEQARSKLEKTRVYLPLGLQAMFLTTIDKVEDFEEKILEWADEESDEEDDDDDDEKEPSLEKCPEIRELFVRVETLERRINELEFEYLSQSVKTDASPPPPNPADNP